MHRSDKIRELLLDMMSPARSVAHARLAEVSEEEWGQAVLLARQHRISPLLHHHCSESGLDAALPHAVRKAWSVSYWQATAEALQHQRALIRLDAILGDIPYAALKGMWLAWHAYPAPALRPVRDIDLLLAPENAVAAFDALTRNGFHQYPGVEQDPAHFVADRKHLPPLVSDDLGIVVELHPRLLHGEMMAEDPVGFGTAHSALATAARRGRGRASLPYPSATTTLLHLIIHSIYDHRCNNGPLVIADIAWTLRGETIDWQYFWATAKARGWERGAYLLFDLTERCCGPLPIEWDGPNRGATPAHILHQTSMLMLQDVEQRSMIRNLYSLSAPTSLAGRVARARQLLRSSPEEVVGAASSTEPDERRWWHYPGWHITRVVRTLKAMTRSEALRDAGRTKDVGVWLGGA